MKRFMTSPLPELQLAMTPTPGAVPRRPSHRRVTLADVARAAGVAPATVSGILNQRDDCYASEETCRRVASTARRLGYRPNPMARALAGKSTATLGLVVPGFDVEPTALKFTGFESAARGMGQLTIAASTQNQPQLEDQAVRWLMDRCVDAIAVYPTEHGCHDELCRVVEEGLPVVTFDGEGRLDLPTDDVSVDCFAGGRMQAQHLLSLGRRRVAIVNGRRSCHIVDQKIAGLEEGLRQAGAPRPVRMNLNIDVFSEQHWHVEELNQIRDFLREHRGEFDAMAAVGDILGMAAVRFAVDLGLRVPEDVAVIGYDGAALASQSTIPLSTIYHPSHEIGVIAYRLLQERLTDRSPGSEPRRQRVAPQLIPRASTMGRLMEKPA